MLTRQRLGQSLLGLCLLALLLAAQPAAAAKRPPNIVFIVADDLGYNDLSANGSPQIPTPHIDAIFQGGVTLSSYHAQPVCSPTRASMLSGRHVIHTSIYMPFDSGVTNEALDPAYTLLPRYLSRAANYSAHLVGKWHCGANERNATPVGRGFRSSFGYLGAVNDYFDMSAWEQCPQTLLTQDLWYQNATASGPAFDRLNRRGCGAAAPAA